jgi:hypothetical protein
LIEKLDEVNMYLVYKKKKLEFMHNKRYSNKFGARRYDFYFPKEDKYVEVTSFSKKYKYNETYKKFIRDYFDNILKKKHFVENILHSKFKLIKLKMNTKKMQHVYKNLL